MSTSPSQATQEPDLFYKQHFNCPVFREKDPELWHLWNFLCQRARIYDQKINWNQDSLFLKKGQLLFGRIQASMETGLSEWTIRTRIIKLIKLNLLKKISEKRGLRGYSVYEVIPLADSAPLPDKTPPKGNKGLTKPLSEDPPTIKKKALPLKENTNKQVKRKVPLSTQLTEKDVCLSNPLIVKNDKHGSLNRFGADFLKFLLGKAKQYAKDPSNPIGLLIHMLRTGSYIAQYADIQKDRQRSQEQLEAMKRMEEEAETARQRQKEAQELALKRSSELIKEDLDFRNQVKAKISPTFRLMRSFISKVFPGDFTIDDVLENPRALSYYSEDLLDIIQSRGCA